MGHYGTIWIARYQMVCGFSRGARESMPGGTMTESDKRVTDPAAHQPSKAELEEDVRIDATPEALAWAITRGGAARRDSDDD